MKEKPLICLVMTSPYFLSSFLSGHVRVWAEHYRVLVLSNFRENAVPGALGEFAEFQHIPIRRKISPFWDMVAGGLLWWRLARLRPSAVLSYTPKAGLLGMVAAAMARVPFRSHFFTGQVWATSQGFRRKLLRGMDAILAACASRLLADSPSQRDFLVQQGVAKSGKIEVLGDGSVGGIDLGRFRPNAGIRRQVRSELGVGDDEVVLLFIGRINREKGIPDLLRAHEQLGSEFSGLHLVVVGPDEESLLVGSMRPNIHVTGFCSSVERFLAASDILCLPSYREGFGSVLLEAGAMGIPVVASRIYGITDAVVDGQTGLLHKAGDVLDLAEKLGMLLRDVRRREEMGRVAGERVRESFSSARLEALYLDWLKKFVPAGQ